jgi:histidyl-tRNA synthetase
VDLSPPRGTVDLLPPRSERIRALTLEAARTAELYGYRYVETPAFEGTDLFKRTSGESSDVVTKEMYTFEDKGGRLLTLRPEGTAPVVRAYLNKAHDLPTPFKGYYLETMWRYGRPQSGRLREFRQFGIEAIGTAAPAADVEVAALGYRYLRAVGVTKFRLEINTIGDETCRPAYRKLLLEYLEENRERLQDEHRDRFRENPLRVLDCKNPQCRAVAAGAPMIRDHLCGPCAEHFEAVLVGLRDEEVDVVEVPTLVRGLDYYTRTAFEYVSDVLSEGQSSIGGAGRYDGLAEVLGGPPTPAVGFAVGLERILLSLEGEGREVQASPVPAAFIVSMGERGRAIARGLAGDLREAGVPVDMSFEDRSLKAQLRMAGRSPARFALIVGDREAGSGMVRARRLSDGHEQDVAPDQLPALFGQNPSP